MRISFGLSSRLLAVALYGAVAASLVILVGSSDTPRTVHRQRPVQAETQPVTIRLLASTPVKVWHISINGQALKATSSDATEWQAAAKWPVAVTTRLVVDMRPSNDDPLASAAVRITLENHGHRWTKTFWGQGGVIAAVNQSDAPGIFEP